MSGPSSEPAIYEAECAFDATGAVEWWGVPQTIQEAVNRRRRGLDIVVRGPDKKANRRKAREVEETVGPAVYDKPHARAGCLALPHYHQKSRTPSGHSFYEVEGRKARERKS